MQTLIRWTKRFGALGFAFFFLKGLAWIALSIFAGAGIASL